MVQHSLNTKQLVQALQAPLAGSSDYDLNPDLRPYPQRSLHPASVLVPLIERDNGINVILTRRASALNHHPGQIAFPGGKQETGDASPLAAALREAHEEIGLSPAMVSVLGGFDLHETVTSFTVSPFVGMVTSDYTPDPDPSEVDEVFEVPLAFVLDPRNMQIHRRRWEGRWRRYYAIPYGPHYIWGATARMIKTLSDRMDAN